MTGPEFYRLAASLGVRLSPYEQRIADSAPPAPAHPRMPADLLRECADAARIAVTHNERDE
jgi:hypothetical protein